MNELTKEERGERARKRVEDYRMALAKAIAKLCALNDLMQFECRDNEWDEEVCYVAQEALLKLGNVLARLTIWYEDEEEE